MKSRLLILFFITFSASITCQTYTWNGAANDNLFFNEANWIDSNTGLAPTGNPINSGTAINRAIIVSDISTTITGVGEINLGTTGSLTITNATITVNAIRGGSLTINESGYLNLELADALRTTLTQINLNSGIGWVRTKLIAPTVIQSTNIGQFKVNSVAASFPTNLRLDNYYFGGTIIRSHVASTSPVTLYDRKNTTGTSVSLAINTIHSGSAITNLNNKSESFVLKRGFMLTVADDEDGTGKSKNYIASEQDLIVNELPVHLLNNISFVRVIPWNWVTKKGIGKSSSKNNSNLDNGWLYNWNRNLPLDLETEYAPMTWGVTGADSDDDVLGYRQHNKVTHVMSFNEPDDCGGQSGQYRDLCQEDVAIGYHKNLMKTGLRIVSPGGREEAPSGWLQRFYDRATAQDIRIDVIAIHWYDWGSNPTVNTNPTAEQVFNRFKSYLTNVYNRYKKPIWITEFNANPARGNAINLAFMQLALPYLESLNYVERYAWFEPNTPDNTIIADYYDENNNLTNVGTYFKNFSSTPSIPEITVNAANNIDIYYQSNPNFTHNLATNGDFKTDDLKAWVGTNSQVLTDTDNLTIVNRNASPDIVRKKPVGSINNDAGTLAQTIEVYPGVSYTVSFDYKWVSGTGAYGLTARVYRDLLSTTTIGSVVLNNTVPNVWFNASFTFTTPANVFRARLFFDKLTGNAPLRIDNVKVTVNTDKTWDGSTSTNWNTASNWVGGVVPSTTDAVFIPRGLTNYPTLTSDITTKRLFVDSGASFMTSGLVTNGISYFVDLPDDKWHLISLPINNVNIPMNNSWIAAAAVAFGQNSNRGIATYQNNIPDATTGPWNYFTGTNNTIANGRGFAIKKVSKGMYVFGGTMTTFPKSIAITVGTGTGSSSWNLIGNPSTSHLDVSAFLLANTAALKDTHEALYVWNAETENYDVLNAGFVSPGQAFFVNANSSTNVSVTSDMLSHQNNVLFYKSATENNLSIKLRASDGIITKETELNYEAGKTKGLDPRFDIGLFDGISSDFHIYTHLLSQNEGIPFIKQALPNSDFETMVVPIGIKSGAKELTFSVNATHLPEGIFVFLEDKQTNTVTRLDETNSSYKITLAESTNTTGRFFLHTKSSGVLSTETFDLQNISIYKTANSTLKIVGLTSGKANIQLFNILGKQVISANFEANNSNELSLPKLASGVYFVKLKHEKGNFTQKIILE